MKSVSEKDWKKLRSLKEQKLSIACDRAFEKLQHVIENKGDESHKAYLKVWKILRQEDRKIGDMFDELKRSNATHKLAAWRKYKLLSDEELEQFSEKTQETIVFLSEL